MQGYNCVGSFKIMISGAIAVFIKELLTNVKPTAEEIVALTLTTFSTIDIVITAYLVKREDDLKRA